MLTSSRRGGPSNWVDRGEPVELTLVRILGVAFHREPLEHGVWLAECARAVYGMVAADASEVAVAGYLNSLARELVFYPRDIRARSTAAALWHVAKVALLRDELTRMRAASRTQSAADTRPLNEVLAGALLTPSELEEFKQQREQAEVRRRIVRPLDSHEWRLYRELRLAALRDAPDAFGSTLAREEVFTEQVWMTRLATGVASPLDRPLVAEESGRAVGLAWARIDASIATLYQVWVHPDARGRGFGQRLLDAAIYWAQKNGAEAMELSVALGPDSAIEFYRRAGFEVTGEPTPLREGSDVLQRQMRRVFWSQTDGSC